MSWKRLVVGVVTACAAAFAQSAPAAGVESEWDVQKLLEELAAGASRLKPLLAQADPAKWNNPDGASAYTPQWKSAVSQIEYFVGATQKFAQKPEMLSAALETFFRLQAMDTAIISLSDGVRKYENPALADLLNATVGKNAPARERLRQYLLELAKQKEEEYQIMDREAQRCRAMITKQPRPAAGSRSPSRSRN